MLIIIFFQIEAFEATEWLLSLQGRCFSSSNFSILAKKIPMSRRKEMNMVDMMKMTLR